MSSVMLPYLPSPYSRRTAQAVSLASLNIRPALLFCLILLIALARSARADERDYPDIPANLFQNNIDRRERQGVFSQPIDDRALNPAGLNLPEPSPPPIGSEHFAANKAPAATTVNPPPAEHPVDPAEKSVAWLQPYARSWQSDATLRSVCFVNTRQGWAVGDQGAIWATTDGGRTWQPQDSRVFATLTAVSFVDEQHGWIGGVVCHPAADATSAVILRTVDGGQNWILDQHQQLPGIRQLRFFNHQVGWCAGQFSTIFGTNIFITENGGRDWQPVVNKQQSDILAALATDQQVAISLANSNTSGPTAMTKRLRFTLASQRGIQSGSLAEWSSIATPFDGLRGPRAMAHDESGNTWLVGQGGLILQNTAENSDWTKPGQLPDSAELQWCDWQAVACRGPKIWIAGTTGGRILHSKDAGQTWQWQKIPTTLPIFDLHFRDERHGWGVGGLGQIILTSDGGQTWETVQGANRRAGVLIVVNEPSQIPWELIAQLSGAQGFRTVVDVLNRRDVEVPSPAIERQAIRVRAALASLGATLAEPEWRFPLRQPGIDWPSERLNQIWGQSAGTTSQLALKNFWRNTLLTWQPAAVLVPQPGPDAPAQDVLLHASCLEYWQATGSSGADPSPPLWSFQPTAQPHAGGLSCQQPVPRTPITLEEWALPARAMARGVAQVGLRGSLRSPQELPAGWSWHWQAGTSPPTNPNAQILSHSEHPADSPTRRMLVQNDTPGFSPTETIASGRRRVWQKMLVQGKLTKSANWLPMLDEFTRGSSPEVAADTLLNLSRECEKIGRLDLAGLIQQHLWQKYPLTTATGQIWLAELRQLSSCELQHWQKRGATPEQGGTAAPGSNTHRARLQKVNEILWRHHPQLACPPEIQFLYHSWHEEHPQEPGATTPPLGLKILSKPPYHSRFSDDWQEVINAELRDTAGRRAPKAHWGCRAVTIKPYLDGICDDETWQKTDAISLRGGELDSDLPPTTTRWAYDAEYLYLAAECQTHDPENQPEIAKTRSRDPDLTAQERIEWYLDLDRDRNTWFHFECDSTGKVSEDCTGDERWNPEYFVAAKRSETGWSVEMAIPLRELTASNELLGQSWIVQVNRIWPRQGLQSLRGTPSTQAHPVDWGTLRFVP
ncbi:MAG: YCF48-related protein [Pirellulales bacterium]|nr:YCF48-related protein [Pirellulales bacterium]